MTSSPPPGRFQGEEKQDGVEHEPLNLEPHPSNHKSQIKVVFFIAQLEAECLANQSAARSFFFVNFRCFTRPKLFAFYQIRPKSGALISTALATRLLKRGADKNIHQRLLASGRGDNSIDPRLDLYSPRRRSAGSDLG